MGSGEPVAGYHLGKVRTWVWATKAFSLHGGPYTGARRASYRPGAVEVSPQPSFIAGSSCIIIDRGRCRFLRRYIAAPLGEVALRPVRLLVAPHVS